MKTNKEIRLLLGSGIIGLFLINNLAFAQAPAGTQMGEGEAIPAAFATLMWEGKIDKAVSMLDSLKNVKTKKDSYSLLLWELMLYENAPMRDPANADSYKSKYNALAQQMIKSYPDKSDTYLLQIQIRPEATAEEIVDLATKAIKANPNNMRAYEFRSRGYRQMGKTAEAEADALKARGM